MLRSEYKTYKPELLYYTSSAVAWEKLNLIDLNYPVVAELPIIKKNKAEAQKSENCSLNPCDCEQRSKKVVLSSESSVATTTATTTTT